MKTLLASLAMLTAAAATTTTPAPVGYRFDDVKRTVTLKTAKNESPAAKGSHAQSGDRVHTGWFSYALIAAEPQRAKFEIFSSTDIQLAGGTPGVILSVERGRIHAMFDKITGSEPRIVQTPGALLAVRGTQYNVEVDAAGKTIVDVFEGTVEIRSPLRPEPFLVRAGETSSFTRRDPPPDRPMKTPDDRRPDAPGRRDGAPPDPRGGHDGSGSGHPGDPGGHGAPPPPPPASRPPQPPSGPGGHH
ncbi:MAG: hypothetical protein QOF63_2019 [Thermoanaerobaculia bacterium]|jgi:hypothetical protein|nr:hypothetical protein [Thermoanaerobaculia bacterium]MEA2414703.1 hypothetical protein [Thermoanaerobaculia bacterium]